MILGWILYATLVSLLLAVAGWAGEVFQRHRGRQTRGAWILSMLASVALPTLWLVGRTDGASPAAGGAGEGPLAVAPAPVRDLLQGAVADGVAGGAADVAVPAFLALWVAGTLYLSIWLLTAAWELQRERTGWERVSDDEGSLLVSDTMGPAAVGFVRPEVVLPRWIFDLDAGSRRLVVLHEREHVNARDPSVVLAGWILVALIPWLLPLWWQFHRLRRALEIDCDRRVVARSGSPRRYASLLLEAVSREASSSRRRPAPVTGGQSFLATRIRRLLGETEPMPRRGREGLRVVSGLGLLTATAAALLLPPPGGGVERGPVVDPPGAAETEPEPRSLTISEQVLPSGAASRSIPVVEGDR